MKGGCGASSAGIFPLCFAGQTIDSACALAQAMAKLQRFPPTYTFNRTMVGVALPLRQAHLILSSTIFVLIPRGVSFQLSAPTLLLPVPPLSHLPPLGLSDCGLADPKALQLHPVLGAFFVAPT